MKQTNGTTVTVRGYAKINLHLDITGRMADGYHRVENVMQTVSLCDTLQITLSDTPGRQLTCNRPELPTGEDNLILRAVGLYAEAIGEELGVRIALDKQIPVAAGLAGGSTDAAATLRGLNRLMGDRLSEEELCAIGARLGADVPFCIVGGTAYADGKGERLHALAPLPPCFAVIAFGGEGVSTAWAYGTLDRRYGNFAGDCYQPHSAEAMCRALANASLEEVAAHLYNIFEAPVCEARPTVERLRRLLAESGAVSAMMSGSGPSVFGLFTEERAAQIAAECVRAQGHFAAVCRPTGRIAWD